MRGTTFAGLVVTLAFAGCGGGSGGEASTATAPGTAATTATGTAYVGRADAVCARMTAEARRMGAAFQSRSDLHGDPLRLTTRNLFRPALPIVEANAKRLRALTAGATSSDFEAFVSLYDPVLALLRQRVEAGEAGDRDRSRALEAQIVELAALQQRLARAAGVVECDVNFVRTFATPGGG